MRPSVGYPQGAVRALLTALPELQGTYDASRASLGESATESSPYVVYAVLLNPYLWKLLESRGGDNELARVFALLENLALDSDYRVRTLLAIDVLEPLAGERIGQRGVTFMGAATRALFEERERFVAAAKRNNLFRRLRSRISALLETRDTRIRRILRELETMSGAGSDNVSAEMRPAVGELRELEARLVSAAERYLRHEPVDAPSPLGPPPESIRTLEWADEESAKAARALYHRWRQLEQLTRALS